MTSSNAAHFGGWWRSCRRYGVSLLLCSRLTNTYKGHIRAVLNVLYRFYRLAHCLGAKCARQCPKKSQSLMWAWRVSIVYADFMRAIFITCMKKLTVHVVDIYVNDKREILFWPPAFLPSGPIFVSHRKIVSSVSSVRCLHNVFG